MFEVMKKCCEDNRENNCSTNESCGRCMCLKGYINEKETDLVSTEDVKKFCEEVIQIAGDPVKFPILELEVRAFKKRFKNIDDNKIIAYYKMKNRVKDT
jgi:hypothetical protein